MKKRLFHMLLYIINFRVNVLHGEKGAQTKG